MYQKPSTSTGTPAGDPPQASFCIASLNELAARAIAIHMEADNLSDGVLNFLHLIGVTGLSSGTDFEALGSNEAVEQIKLILESPFLTIDNDILKNMSRVFGGCDLKIEGSANPREASRKISLLTGPQNSPVVPSLEIRVFERSNCSITLGLDGECAPGSKYSQMKQDLLAKLGVTALAQLEYHRHLGNPVLRTLAAPGDVVAKNLQIVYQKSD